MIKLAEESGFARAAVVAFILIVIIGALYLSRRRGEDVADVGKSVAGELEQAANAVADTSKDAILTAKVEAALALSKSASGFDIKVSSDDGTVTLDGSLPSSEARAAVVEVARDTEGVVSVVDRIEVDPGAAPPQARDGELAERLAEVEIESAVYQGLLRSEGIDGRAIRVEVDGRVVRLLGSVPDSGQRERAAALAASVAGVERVMNELEVSDRTARAGFPPAPR